MAATTITATITSRTGVTRTVTAAAGTSFKDAILSANLDDLVGLCGGYASCGTCQVYVAPQWLALIPPPDETEAGLLEGSRYATPQSRLACQVILDAPLDGITATLAPEE